jgi:hypothetical protein
MAGLNVPIDETIHIDITTHKEKNSNHVMIEVLTITVMLLMI